MNTDCLVPKIADIEVVPPVSFVINCHLEKRMVAAFQPER